MSTRDSWAVMVYDTTNGEYPDWKSFVGACSYVDLGPKALRPIRWSVEGWKDVVYTPFQSCRDHVLEYLDWGVHEYARSRV